MSFEFYTMSPFGWAFFKKLCILKTPKISVLKLKEAYAFLEMPLLKTTHVFAMHFIDDSHFCNSLSKRILCLKIYKGNK